MLRAMSEENVETVERLYAAYNAAVSAPNPLEAIHAWLERFYDPEVEWEVPADTVSGQEIFHGIDGVMEFFERVLDAFEQGHQVPERLIDCGDEVLVFVRLEVRGRTSGLETSEPEAHLVTVRDGKIVRLQLFRDRAKALEAAGLSE
jgi:ketosteroid isomerase-like protein